MKIYKIGAEQLCKTSAKCYYDISVLDKMGFDAPEQFQYDPQY